MNNEKNIPFTNHSTIYGPVKSWRFGQSLGVDPIFHTSTCSFNCIYCQLGHIQNITSEIKEYVSTQQVLSDFDKHIQNFPHFDVITFSGSGEPTLAKNLKEMALGLKNKTQAPLLILTNATHLHVCEVQKNLQAFDRLIIKLDAWSEQMLQKINRPAKGITHQKILDSIVNFKAKTKATIDLQIMVMPINYREIAEMGAFLKELAPAHVQLNTPKRPYPLSWHRENRGNHLGIFDHEVQKLKVVGRKEAKILEEKLKGFLASDSIVSIYHN